MVLGRGAFGTVYLSMGPGNQRVALKQVQNSEKEPRELKILQCLQSPYCSSLIDHFYREVNNVKYLYMVTDIMPESLGSYLSRARQFNQFVHPILMKLFSYQMLSGIAYIHSLSIVHRDIKTENCLVDANQGRLKVSDFGIAKKIGKGDENGSYVASRFYRAPELLLGCRRYTNKIDIWAAGCVIAEMLLRGTPMFQGSSNHDQLTQIVQVLGQPTAADAESFEHPIPFPEVERICSLTMALPVSTPVELLVLLKGMFSYNPEARPSAEQCMASPYFDELFEPGVTLPNGGPLPELAPRTEAQ
jgi:glycogen synthase kinase 3 beta